MAHLNRQYPTMNFPHHRRTISRLLQKRLAAYPRRDESYDRLQEGLGQFADFLMDGSSGMRFSADAVGRVRDLLERPVFIGGNMKSGTTLMLQLLDGGEEVLALPGDTHLVNKYLDERHEFRSLTRTWIKRLVNPTGKEPFWFLGKDESGWRTFVEALRFACGEEGWRNDVERVVFAIHRALGWERARVWVEKTPRNELHVDRLLELYPNARFLHMFRCPLENVASIKKLAAVRNRAFSALGSQPLKRYFEKGMQNAEEMPERYLIVRYEDLVRDPREEMRRVGRFLGLEWTEGFCVPSENGRPARSNSMYSEERVRGQVRDQSRRRKWEEVLTEEEKRAVVGELWETAVKAGYESWREPEVSRYRQTGEVSWLRRVLGGLRRRGARLLPGPGGQKPLGGKRE